MTSEMLFFKGRYRGRAIAATGARIAVVAATMTLLVRIWFYATIARISGAARDVLGINVSQLYACSIPV